PPVPARRTWRPLRAIATPSGPIVSPGTARPRAVIFADESRVRRLATCMVSRAVRRQRAGAAHWASEAHGAGGPAAQRAVNTVVSVLRTRTFGAVKVSTLPSGMGKFLAITQVSGVDCRESQRKSPVCAAARPAGATRTSSPAVARARRARAPREVAIPSSWLHQRARSREVGDGLLARRGAAGRGRDVVPTRSVLSQVGWGSIATLG